MAGVAEVEAEGLLMDMLNGWPGMCVMVPILLLLVSIGVVGLVLFLGLRKFPRKRTIWSAAM